MAPAPQAQEKLRLLCLHGYTQNAEVFKSRIGSWRKGLKSRAEFIFVDAPFESQGLPGVAAESGGVETGGRSWWQWTDTGPSARPSLAAQYTGWDASLSTLVGAIKEHRPHGILGFSQGATAAALLLSALASDPPHPELSGVPLPHFAIIISGFVPRDTDVADLLAASPPATRALFVAGEADSLVPPGRSQALMSHFRPGLASLYTHAGAHLVPTCSGDFKQLLVGFLEQAQEEGSTSAPASILAHVDSNEQ